MIRHLNDPEHPLSLEQLKVATLENIKVDNARCKGTQHAPSDSLAHHMLVSWTEEDDSCALYCSRYTNTL